jgi:hypothetical protein
MRALFIAATSCFALASCDGGFSFNGTVSSAGGKPLTDCSAVLRHEGSADIWEQSTFVAPSFHGHFMVAPSQGIYFLTIACAAHFSKRVTVKYGTEVLPGKSLNIGNIVLVPIGGQGT